jgi:hypothetical protein
MPTFVDLSAPIASTAPDIQPPFLRVDIDVTDHDAGAEQISQTLGVPRRLMRNEEWAAPRSCTSAPTTRPTSTRRGTTTRDRRERAQTIDELPLEWFYAPGVKLDMRAKTDGDAVTPQDCEASCGASATNWRRATSSSSTPAATASTTSPATGRWVRASPPRRPTGCTTGACA